MTSSTPNSNNPKLNFSISSSDGLWSWLKGLQISLAFTTYQSNRLFLVGSHDSRLVIKQRLFDKPMGLYLQGNSLYMSTRYQLWQLENRLAVGETYESNDCLFIPSLAHITGDINVHDVAVDQNQKLIFVNTDFSCLASLRSGFSFEPVWKPAFISKLAAEDRCHLNGLAMRDGEPVYATACSNTDYAAGWRDQRNNGGIVIHIPDNEIIATGLSMPHSPRWYQDRLWLLNSGTGELGYLDGERFVAVTFCPGFVRGLAFFDNFALVGLSKLRHKTATGLALETRLAASGEDSQCGLMIIDLQTGKRVHSLRIDGIIEEVFSVVVLPNVQRPNVIGLQNEDIESLINFPGSYGIIRTRPAVKSPAIRGTTQQTELPCSPQLTVNYQRVYHLTPENLVPYDSMTFPSLQTRWQTQPQQGELLAVSASVAGEMVGLVVAERFEQQAVQPLSLYVLPAYRSQGIGTNLIKHLQRIAGQII